MILNATVMGIIKMELTKQQEKDINKALELKKQLNLAKQTCSILPGIDLEYTLVESYDEVEIDYWKFVSTEKTNKNIDVVVKFLNYIDGSEVYEFGEVEDNLSKSDKLFNKIIDLQDKIVKSFLSIPIDIEDDVYELIWGNWTIEDFLKAIELNINIKIKMTKSEQNKIKNLEKDLEQIKDPKIKKKLIEILSS